MRPRTAYREARPMKTTALSLTIALLVAGCAALSGNHRAGTEQRFTTPHDAVATLVAACRANDVPALVAIFGDEGKRLINTGDAAADRERCTRFLAAADQQTRLDPKRDGAIQLV